MTLEEYLTRVHEVLVDAGEAIVLVAEKVKPLQILDEELVERLDEIENRVLALLVDVWRDEAS